MRIRCIATALWASTAVISAAAAQAQTPAEQAFEIPAGPAADALDAFARQTRMPLVYTAQSVRHVRTAAVKGRHTPQAALAAMLDGTGLVAVETPGGGTAIRPIQAADAQTGAGAEADEVEEIVVTANKREERLRDVPTSITAETGATLARRGATQLEDVIRNTPGFSNPGSGAGNATNLTIRGVTSGSDLELKQSTVALLLDDVPLDPAPSASASSLRLVDIERVEVLRGPQGTLFGSGSLSGALRLITRKPDLAEFGGAAELTGATTADGDESIAGHLVLNVPIAKDRLAFRAVGYGFSDGGWVDNIRSGKADINGNDTYGGRLGVAFEPSDRFTLGLTAAYQDSHDHGAGESFYSPPAGGSKRATDLVKSNESDVESTLVSLRGTYDFDAVTLTSTSAYIRRDFLEREDFGFFNDLLSLLLGVPGLSGSAPATTDSRQDIITQELRLSSDPAQRLRWTAGLYYLKVDIDGGQLIASNALVPITGATALSDIRTQGDQEEFSAFGEATYTLADRVDLTAGVRVARTSLAFRTHSSGILLTGNPDPAVVVDTSIEQEETSTSPRLSLAYRPNSDLTLYAQAARGYRVGGPNLGASLGGPDIPTHYDSDSLWNYEIGAKASLLDGKLRFNTAAYQIDWSDIQAGLSLNSVAYIGNAGDARIRGLELEAEGRPSEGLQLGGALSLSHGELTTGVPNLTRVTGAVGVQAGERLPASPEVQISGFAQGAFRVFGKDGYVRASAQYIGDQYADFGEKGARFGDFTTVDLRAGVELGRVELVGFINNLLDSDGARGALEPIYVGPLLAFPQRAYRIRPRTIGATARMQF